MESPGIFLKRERELRGVTLDEIADKTKVGKRLLIAIEADDFGSLPAPLFVKGFMKAYAKCIGLDENEAVLRYSELLEGLNKEDEFKEVKEKQKSEGSWLNAPVLALTALLIISLVFAYFYLRSTDGPLLEPPEKQKKAVAVEKSIEKDTVIPDSKSTEDAPHIASKEISTLKDDEAIEPPLIKEPEEKIEQKELILAFEALQDTWIWVKIDDKEVSEVLLRAGKKVEWKGEKGFQIIVGNAGGVKASLNGKPLGNLGKTGEVARLMLPDKPL